MAGIAPVVTAQVIQVVIQVVILVAVTVMPGMSMIVPVMAIAVQNHGLVMALKTVKIRHGAVTLPVMTMMVVTVMVALLMAAQLVALKDVQTVNLISLLTDLNAVIQLGMSLVLTV